MFHCSLQRFKPGVSRSVHLFVAPLLWTAIGVMLMIRGFLWIGRGPQLWLLAALVIGTAKSLLVLDKTALRSIDRIKGFSDSTCLGAVYSWKTWILVGVMMASGIVLRTVTEPGRIIGTIYVAIGWALFLSSRHGWLEWSSWSHGH